MAKKPTNEELKKRVKELEKEAVERKHAEEALRESEEKLKEAQRMGKIGHWEFDLDSQKLLWSITELGIYFAFLSFVMIIIVLSSSPSSSRVLIIRPR